MTNPTSASHTAPAAMWLCLGILLCSFSLTAQAAQPQTTEFDLLSLQITHADTKYFSGYQLNTTVGDSTRNNLVFGKAFRLPTLAELKKGGFWTTSIRWNYTNNGIGSSFSPRLRFESKESRIELNPLKRSVSMTWRRDLP